MKIHFQHIKTVVKTLQMIFEEQQYADQAIKKVLKENTKQGSNDRAFIAETTYDIVRWWRRLWAQANIPINSSEKDLYTIVGVYLKQKGFETHFREFAHIPKTLSSGFSSSIQHAIPDWLEEIAGRELGPKWPSVITSLNQQAPVFLRCNTLKTSKDELILKLREENIDAFGSDDNEFLLQLKQRKNVFQTKAFKDGLFEVQDGGSQCISSFLGVEPGMRVIDACAGAGGKTLHLAALMKNKGRIIALDTEEWKLQELKSRARRAGISIIETRVIESSKTIKRLQNGADALLLDVPCSGLGVLRRNPDAKWKLQPEFIDRIKTTQKEILTGYSKMLVPGGKMVYATCSILPSENEQQVVWFLENNAGYKLLKQRTIMPGENHFDGFYMGLIKKD